MITLQDMIEIASTVCDRAWDKYHVIKPHWYAISRKGERCIVPRPPGPFSKEQIAVLVRRALAELDVVQVVFVDEVWSLLAETQAQIDEINKWYETHDGLEDFPGREECVMFQAEDEDGRLLSAKRTITRTTARAQLGPLEIYEIKSTEGRLTGWLPARGTRQ